MSLFLDNFTGSAGALSAHTADSGQSWAGSNAFAVLDGSGLLYNSNTASGNVALVSNAVIPQTRMRIDMAISIGTLPSAALADTDVGLAISLWGAVQDYSVQLSSNIAGVARLYASAAGTSASIVIASNTTHTVSFDIVFGSHTDIYIDGVLATAAYPVNSTPGDTTLAFVFSRSIGTGTPGPMLYIDSLAFSGPVSPFWTSYVNCLEVDS